MKAILVIDMPKDCGNCPCVGEEFGICQADEKNRDCDWYKTPSWCPLRLLPKRDDGKLTEYCGDWGCGYADGWNTCLGKIMGETE